MQTSRLKLSPNFAIEEFDCRNGARVPRDAEAALVTWCRVWGEPLRKRFGPVRITSGYRTPAYNRSVGGAAASYHVYSLGSFRGVAADCVPATGDPAAWSRWAAAHMTSSAWALVQGRGAAVPYPSSGFIHLDTGPRRSWAG